MLTFEPMVGHDHSVLERRLGLSPLEHVNLCVSALLGRVNVPDNIVGETIDSVACSLGHFGKSFGLGLILEGISREVDAY